MDRRRRSSMESEAAPKRARVTGGNKSTVVAGEPDRLSDLPDCLLHAIMSLMKARQVVQTCVLSTPWRHLWRSVPCLDLDLDEFKKVDQENMHENLMIPLMFDEDDKDWEDFADFAVNLMIRRNIALLDSFRLHLNEATAPQSGRRRAYAWLRRAMKHCAPDPGIRREGLSSDSWRLKRLQLCNLPLDSRFTDHVSSACHSLEHLELQDCECEVFAIISHSLKNLVLNLKTSIRFGLSDITSSTLKSLVIDSGRHCPTCPLVITAPAVAYLHLAVNVDGLSDGISINEMTCLDKASINLSRHYGGVVVREHELHDQFELLCSVSNVTHLELSNLVTTVRIEESKFFEKFKNLRTLLLDNCDLSDESQTLALFLENSPNLEKLTLWHCKFSNDSKRKNGTPRPKETPSSQCRSFEVLCANLKLTEIIYKYDDDVRQLVELLPRISGNLPKNLLKLTKVD